MAIKKSGGTSNGVVKPPVQTQTAPAPVSRNLNTGSGAPARVVSRGRDYDAEARGKVANASFSAALQSPGIAGLKFTNIKEYLALVKEAADEMVAYSWEHQDNK